MPKRVLAVNWKEIDGAAVKKRILHLKASTDGTFLCPVTSCLHLAFKSNRGVRKHINNTHSWYYFFDAQPTINREEAEQLHTKKLKASTHKMPSFSLDDGIGLDFLEWLQTPCGGGKKIKEAIQIGRRGMKFLMAAMGDPDGDKNVKEDYIDCCVGSPTIVMAFLKVLTEEWEIGSSGALGYMKAISDLMDFRKANGVSDNVLRTFAVTEVYIRRGKENLAKQKKLEYARNLDLETLIARNSWATMEEMETVIPYHTPKYEYVLRKCNAGDQPPTVSELSFATRYIVTFLFLRVKCTRPMTYQFMTLQMLTDAKRNGGYIDHTAFKTQDKYVFDTLVLSKDVSHILDTYVDAVRPLLNPSCEYVLLTNNGTQYHALGTAMSLLVHQAIGKSVNPTRYRQIVESQSAVQLTTKERETISKDQKHSSNVAKRIYQKRLSREVAVEGKACMQKMVGTHGQEHSRQLAASLRETFTQVDGGECSTSTTTSQVATSQTLRLSSDDELVCEEIVDDEKVVRSEGTVDVVDQLAPEMEVLSKQTAGHISESELSTEGRKESSPTPACSGSVADAIDVEGTDVPVSTISLTSACDVRNKDQTPQIPPDDLEVKKEELEKELTRGTRLLRFTIEEDSFLRQGFQKYGKGKWSHILKDKELKFHSSRTRDSLRMRADTIGITGKKKRVRKVYDMR